MNMMEVVTKASALETHCNTFLEKSGESLPRVQFREAAPLFKELSDLAVTAGMTSTPILFVCPVDNNGLRCGPMDAACLLQIYYREGEFSAAWTSKPIATPEGLTFVGLPGFRPITDSDILELGITPREMVEFMKSIANKMAMDFSLRLSGGKVGNA